MRRVLTALIAFAVLFAAAATALAHERQSLRYQTRDRNRVRLLRLDGRRVAVARVLGVRMDRRDNYGRRRSALAHRQRDERKALKRLQKRQRRALMLRGLNRRDLAHLQRNDMRQLRRQQFTQRRQIRRFR